MVVRIHGRVCERHPELTEEDVLHAWANAFLVQERFGGGLPMGTLLALGDDPHGRTVEMVGVELEDGSVLVYHAMTPPTRKAQRELRRALR